MTREQYLEMRKALTKILNQLQEEQDKAIPGTSEITLLASASFQISGLICNLNALQNLHQ